MATPTPSQTAGPFVSIGTAWATAGANAGEEGSRPDVIPGSVVVSGKVFDGAGDPVGDAMMEFWQADAEGRFPPEAPPPWSGFARVLTAPDGSYRFVTVKPGAVPGASGEGQAPHIDVSIFARGLQQRLVTRAYFSDEGLANATDPVLAALPEAARATLVAEFETEEPRPAYRLDLWLQGEKETVFFAPW